MAKRTDFQEVIRRKILTGDFRPGESIPEESLAAEFSSSRTPIREALILLGADGIIDNETNRGFSVASVSIERIRSTFEAMRTVYPALAALALARAEPVDVSSLQSASSENRVTVLDHFDFMGRLSALSRNSYLRQSALATETYHGFVRNSVMDNLSADDTEAAERELFLHQSNLVEAFHDKDAEGVKEEIGHMTEGSRVFLISHLL